MTTQGTHHFIIAVQNAAPNSTEVITWEGTANPIPGQTRADVYNSLRAQFAQQHPAVNGGVVVFFSLERNEL